MLPVDTSFARQQAQDTHLNSQGMEALRAKGRNGDPEALREVARQFESMFVHQMLKQMRSTNEVFGKDSFLSSEETKFHEEMLDQQMSLELTQGRGLGLAEMLYKQMQSAYGDYLTKPEPLNPAAATGTDLSRESSTDFSRNPSTVQTKRSEISLGDSPEEFIKNLTPHAQAAAEKLGVKPEALVAQAALETGWGQHLIHDRQGKSSHNLFNIKADQRWAGERVNVSTLEFRDGLPQMERSDFRQYQDYQESFADYVDFLQNNPRYQQALSQGADPERYAEALQSAGYATDPAYADKIKSLLRSDPFAGFTSPTEAEEADVVRSDTESGNIHERNDA